MTEIEVVDIADLSTCSDTTRELLGADNLMLSLRAAGGMQDDLHQTTGGTPKHSNSKRNFTSRLQVGSKVLVDSEDSGSEDVSVVVYKQTEGDHASRQQLPPPPPRECTSPSILKKSLPYKSPSTSSKKLKKSLPSKSSPTSSKKSLQFLPSESKSPPIAPTRKSPWRKLKNMISSPKKKDMNPCDTSSSSSFSGESLSAAPCPTRKQVKSQKALKQVEKAPKQVEKGSKQVEKASKQADSQENKQNADNAVRDGVENKQTESNLQTPNSLTRRSKSLPNILQTCWEKPADKNLKGDDDQPKLRQQPTDDFSVVEDEDDPGVTPQEASLHWCGGTYNFRFEVQCSVK